jgi:hypothetical protein
VSGQPDFVIDASGFHADLATLGETDLKRAGIQFLGSPAACGPMVPTIVPRVKFGDVGVPSRARPETVRRN